MCMCGCIHVSLHVHIYEYALSSGCLCKLDNWSVSSKAMMHLNNKYKTLFVHCLLWLI